MEKYLDEVSKEFHFLWRTWKHEQGWRYGPDSPQAMLSPLLREDYDKMPEGDKQWFRNHAALVIAAQKRTGPQVVEADFRPLVQKAIKLLAAKDVDFSLVANALETANALTLNEKLQAGFSLAKFGPWDKKRLSRILQSVLDESST